MSPKSFLAGAILLALAIPASAATLKVTSGTIGVSCDDKGIVTVLNAKGEARLQINDYKLMWSPGQTDGGSGSYFTTPEGARGLQVDYRIKDDTTGKLKIQAQFVPKDGVLNLHYDIQGAEDTRGLGAMLALRGKGARVERSIVRLGLWKRDDAGGVPYEVPDTSGIFYTWPNETALVKLTGCNLNWSAGADVHLPARTVSPTAFTADGQVVLTTFRAQPTAAAALLAGRSLTLDTWTDKPFNVWDSGGHPFLVQARAGNLTNAQRNVNLKWWARDFQGRLVGQSQATLLVDANSEDWETIMISPIRYGILFLEIQAESGGETLFTRTNLAVIPPHQFGPAEGSIFGMAAFFPHPSEDEALKMLQRLGVRWLRGSGTSGTIAPEKLKALGIRQNYSRGFLPTDTAFKDPAHTKEWLSQQSAIAVAQNAPYWEAGNEWNMVGGVNKGTYAKQYAEQVLVPVAEIRRNLNPPVKIMSQGLAGGDLTFLDAMYNAGGWDKIDAVGLHPGRGNYTPDYDGQPLGPGKDPEFWNFLGTIRKIKERVAKYGEKPIFLTEAYACTRENAAWNDTYRHAAEHVILSYALALSEGIAQMNWYQFNDSVWFNQGGVSATDPEYHYGLMNRDLSPKPSALAYRTIALALDGATFVRWLKFEDPNNRGLLFNTPRGPLTILWNRADGYQLNQKNHIDAKRFAAPEAWVDDWPTKTKLSLPATPPRVTEIDCIGQERDIQVAGGKVELQLDGAPRLYYGLAVGQE